jgi:hypothetical protein
LYRPLHREQGMPMTGPLAMNLPPARKFHYVDPPQPGNLEHFQTEAEESRFRALLSGRDPTPDEQATHESNLKTIREAHDAV